MLEKKRMKSFGEISNETSDRFLDFVGTIYQPLRSGRIWHKVDF